MVQENYHDLLQLLFRGVETRSSAVVDTYRRKYFVARSVLDLSLAQIFYYLAKKLIARLFPGCKPEGGGEGTACSDHNSYFESHSFSQAQVKLTVASYHFLLIEVRLGVRR